MTLPSSPSPPVLLPGQSAPVSVSVHVGAGRGHDEIRSSEAAGGVTLAVSRSAGVQRHDALAPERLSTTLLLPLFAF